MKAPSYQPIYSVENQSVSPAALLEKQLATSTLPLEKVILSTLGGGGRQCPWYLNLIVEWLPYGWVITIWLGDYRMAGWLPYGWVITVTVMNLDVYEIFMHEVKTEDSLK